MPSRKLTLTDILQVKHNSGVPVLGSGVEDVPEARDRIALQKDAGDENNGGHGLQCGEDDHEPLKPGMDTKQSNEENGG